MYFGCFITKLLILVSTCHFSPTSWSTTLGASSFGAYHLGITPSFGTLTSSGTASTNCGNSAYVLQVIADEMQLEIDCDDRMDVDNIKTYRTHCIPQCGWV